MGAERRQGPRKRVELPPGLRMSWRRADGQLRPVVGKLVDVSEGGVGVEVFLAPPGDALVELDGEWTGPAYGLRLNGRARVAHVTEIEPGRYRVGLRFVEVALARGA
jgi:hypothetical protein